MGAVGQAQGAAHVLLDQQDAQTRVAQIGQDLKHLLSVEGRQAHRWFVEQQQLRPVHQGAGNGQHLLFTAREVARHLMTTLL